MSQIVSFLKSKVFFVQLAKALLIVLVGGFLFTQILKWTTHHGETIEIPDLKGIPLDSAAVIIENAQLRYSVIDSSKFDPNFPPFSVLEQSPSAAKKVKVNRKLYLTLNPSGYNNVTIPDIIQITRRNAISKLQAVGILLDTVTYINALGKDMVYEIKFNGKPIQIGEKIPKMSKIELVCGDGNRPNN